MSVMHAAVKPVLFAACWKLQVIDLVSLKVTFQHRISTKSLLPWRRLGVEDMVELGSGQVEVSRVFEYCSCCSALRHVRQELFHNIYLPNNCRRKTFYPLHTYFSTPSFLPGFVHLSFDIISSPYPSLSI